MQSLQPDTPQLHLLYHYFHPDDVVSARLYTDLAKCFAEHGWNVVAAPCNRGCRDEAKTHSLKERVGEIEVHRVWRPSIRQSSSLGRVVNASWMIGAWSLRAITSPRRKQEVVVIGTDPIFGVLSAIAWRVFRPGCKIVHWCHDLYPEALIADGILKERSILLTGVRWLLARAYRRCDLIADLGCCMRKLLLGYGAKAEVATLVPWALVEPSRPVDADPQVRRSLFGDAKLGLLYSGNFGRAHEFHRFLELARSLRRDSIHFCFAARGNRVAELRAAVTAEDTNISFAGFASEEELERRLGACDLHLVSMRESWTGTVVPSKFFGAIATGRGVLFDGAPDSAITEWIKEFSLGWILTGENTPEIATLLRTIANHPEQLDSLKARCHATYQQHFSRTRQFELWRDHLSQLINEKLLSNMEGAHVAASMH